MVMSEERRVLLVTRIGLFQYSLHHGTQQRQKHLNKSTCNEPLFQELEAPVRQAVTSTSSLNFLLRQGSMTTEGANGGKSAKLNLLQMGNQTRYVERLLPSKQWRGRAQGANCEKSYDEVSRHLAGISGSPVHTRAGGVFARRTPYEAKTQFNSSR